MLKSYRGTICTLGEEGDSVKIEWSVKHNVSCENSEELWTEEW